MTDVFMYSTAFGSNSDDGMVLFGKFAPAVSPKAASLALKFGSCTTGTMRPFVMIAFVGSMWKAGRTYCRFTPAFGRSASARVLFWETPAPERILRHSSFQKKKVFSLLVL